MATVGVERRRTFYEMQRRHRRSGWKFTVLSAVAVLCLGLPVSVLVSPFIGGAALIVNDVVNVVTPTPDVVGEIGEAFDDPGPGAATPESGDEPIPPATLAWLALGLVVPGMVLIVVVWLCVRRLFLRAGAGAVALAAGARPPNPGDVEERQLVNLVEEMALAAGIPPPRVLVVDSDDANAAVAGRSARDATVIVPRGLLTRLGRGPTGGIVADMLAVVVIGDLRAAMVIASAFQTFDVVGALLAAPLSRRTRRALWGTFRLALRPRSRVGDGVEEHFIAQELAYVAQLGALDEDEPKGTLVTLLTFPFLVASIAYALTRMIFGGFVVAPIMAALWRRRRLLADATAVELTRDPDGLARALRHLLDSRAVVPPGPWTHLCAIGPEVGRARAMRDAERRRDEIWGGDRRPGESRGAALRRRLREANDASTVLRGELREADEARGPDGAPDDLNHELASFLPVPDKRLARLAEMGAHVPDDPATAWTPRPVSGWARLAGWVIGVPLVLLIAALFLALLGCVATFVYMALLFEMALVAPVVLVAHALLR